MDYCTGLPELSSPIRRESSRLQTGVMRAWSCSMWCWVGKSPLQVYLHQIDYLYLLYHFSKIMTFFLYHFLVITLLVIFCMNYSYHCSDCTSNIL